MQFRRLIYISLLYILLICIALICVLVLIESERQMLEPKWVKQLATWRPYLLLETKQIKQLEKLRREHDIEHDVLFWLVMGSRVSTRRFLRHMLEDYREHHPEASEKELFKMMVARKIMFRRLFRRAVNSGTDDMPPNYPKIHESEYKEDDGTMVGTYSIDEQELNQVMEGINSFDDLCEYIISMDEQKQASADPLGIGERIDQILAQEELRMK